MTFGEKVREERKKRRMTQDELARELGINRRTVFTWESGRAYPQSRKVYAALARALNVPVNYLLADEEAFIMESGERFGYRGKREAEELTREITGLFAGGQLEEEDMDMLMFAVQEAYVEAKNRNKKYTPKKYAGEDQQPDPPYEND